MLRIACLETARRVSTLAAAAQGLLQFALVDVAAYLPRRVHLVSVVADAPISPHKILASAIDADVGILGALIDVCSNNVLLIRIIRLIRTAIGFELLKF